VLQARPRPATRACPGRVHAAGSARQSRGRGGQGRSRLERPAVRLRRCPAAATPVSRAVIREAPGPAELSTAPPCIRIPWPEAPHRAGGPAPQDTEAMAGAARRSTRTAAAPRSAVPEAAPLLPPGRTAASRPAVDRAVTTRAPAAPRRVVRATPAPRTAGGEDARQAQGAAVPRAGVRREAALPEARREAAPQRGQAGAPPARRRAAEEVPATVAQVLRIQAVPRDPPARAAPGGRRAGVRAAQTPGRTAAAPTMAVEEILRAAAMAPATRAAIPTAEARAAGAAEAAGSTERGCKLLPRLGPLRCRRLRVIGAVNA